LVLLLGEAPCRGAISISDLNSDESVSIKASSEINWPHFRALSSIQPRLKLHDPRGSRLIGIHARDRQRFDRGPLLCPEPLTPVDMGKNEEIMESTPSFDSSRNQPLKRDAGRFVPPLTVSSEVEDRFCTKRNFCTKSN